MDRPPLLFQDDVEEAMTQAENATQVAPPAEDLPTQPEAADTEDSEDDEDGAAAAAFAAAALAYDVEATPAAGPALPPAPEVVNVGAKPKKKACAFDPSVLSLMCSQI